MPDIELGINDMWRQGKEVVGRHDIIPVVTEEWIRLENVEFHSCVQQDEYEKSRIIKYVCYRNFIVIKLKNKCDLAKHFNDSLFVAKINAISITDYSEIKFGTWNIIYIFALKN